MAFARRRHHRDSYRHPGGSVCKQRREPWCSAGAASFERAWSLRIGPKFFLCRSKPGAMRGAITDLASIPGQYITSQKHFDFHQDHGFADPKQPFGSTCPSRRPARSPLRNLGSGSADWRPTTRSRSNECTWATVHGEHSNDVSPSRKPRFTRGC